MSISETPQTGWFDGETATFGDRVTAAREAAGLEQSDLADRLGVHLETIEAWENDRVEPRSNKLQMLAGLLSVSMVWLMTGEGDDSAGVPEPVSGHPGMQAVLDELRDLRSEQANLLERMGRLERKLRTELAAL